MNILSFFKTSIKGDLTALFAGIILAFAFAPCRIFPLAILSCALLLCTWMYVSQKRAFIRGLLFGIGEFSVGTPWIFVSLHTFGNIATPLAFCLTALFILILSLFSAFAGYFLQRFFPKNNSTKLLCAFPAIFLISSWIRGTFFSGFPWLELGYSQTNSPLQGLAPFLGVYGISLAVIFSAALCVYGLLNHRQHLRFALLTFLLLWIISGILSFFHWTHPVAKPLQVSLLQGNISQSIKWQPDKLDQSIDTYLKLTQEHWDSPLIVWPETAMPLINTDAKSLLDSLDVAAKQHHTAIFMGIPYEENHQFYNALLALGTGNGHYFKRRLVPFGEFLPHILFLNDIYNDLGIPIPSLTPGPFIQADLQINNLSFASFICYEIAFPDQVRSFIKNANAIVVVSDDAWFGDSFAPTQHLQMAQMQAMETGRFILFDSNSGVTAIIDDHGTVRARAPAFVQTVLTGTFQPMAGHTVFMYVGSNIALLIALIFLIIAVRQQYKPSIRMD